MHILKLIKNIKYNCYWHQIIQNNLPTLDIRIQMQLLVLGLTYGKDLNHMAWKVPSEPPDFYASKPKERVGCIGNQPLAENTQYAYTATKLDMKIISKLHKRL